MKSAGKTDRRIRATLISLGGMLTACLIVSCETMKTVATGLSAVGVSVGPVSTEQLQAGVRAGTALAKVFESVTPEQEYYIGRAVAATVLQQYPPLDNESVNRYVNLVGQSLAQASDKPETFGGYHFLVLDSDEINAFGAPGGLILVSRGMLRLCKSEDALAAVLAHEIGHVQYQHGLRAIQQSRLTSALTITGTEAAKQFGGQDVARLSPLFEGAITDITTTMMKTGYARHLETEADQSAVIILKRVGYDPNALNELLAEMSRQLKPGGPGFARTHPDPQLRIKDVSAQIGEYRAAPAPAARQERFDRALGNLIASAGS